MPLLFAHQLKNDLQKIISSLKDFGNGNMSLRIQSYSQSILGDLVATFNRMAETLQQRVAELNRDKTQLSTILSNMVESVVVVDMNGRIVLVNPALAQLFHVDAAASVGKLFLEQLRHNPLNQLISTVLSDGKSRVDEVKTFSPEERTFDAHAVPLSQNGQLTGVLLVLHDITRLRKLELLRKEFVANVSHELRTPLASMRGYAETLRLGAVDDKENRLEFLKSIENQAEQMTRLVDDLLDLAAIESGKRGIQKKALRMADLIAEVVGSLKNQAEKKQVRISVGPFDKLPEVMGDATQIKQVLTNLLDNAIKFNKEGGEVRITASSDGKYIQTQVQDSGLGIPDADIQRVFERFYRVDKARSRELGGTGLGLAIVKHIVESHGGHVSVQSREEAGSTFVFSLPLI